VLVHGTIGVHYVGYCFPTLLGLLSTVHYL